MKSAPIRLAAGCVIALALVVACADDPKLGFDAGPAGSGGSSSGAGGKASSSGGDSGARGGTGGAAQAGEPGHGGAPDGAGGGDQGGHAGLGNAGETGVGGEPGTGGAPPDDDGGEAGTANGGSAGTASGAFGGSAGVGGTAGTGGSSGTAGTGGSGACEVTWYRDADDDGFGDPAMSVEACANPDGYVANDLDCYDANALARPTQTDYFEDDRGDGSYDYNCDDDETSRWIEQGKCPDIDLNKPGSVGWVSLPPPACGWPAAWKSAAVCPAAPLSRTQRCR